MEKIIDIFSDSGEKVGKIFHHIGKFIGKNLITFIAIAFVGTTMFVYCLIRAMIKGNAKS